MRIDIHNYEAFFLDYKEGNLDAEQVSELFAFLEEYPQLKAELDSFELVELDLEEDVMDKSFLRKREMGDEELVAYVENDLSASDRAEVELLVAQNNVLAKELRLFKSTVLAADESVKFPNKNRLKKRGVVIFLQSNPAYLRVAAALLLMLGMFFLVSRLTKNESAQEIKPVLAVENNKGKNASSNEKNNLLEPQKGNVSIANIDPHKNASVRPSKIVNSIKKGFDVVNHDAPITSNTVTVNSATLMVSNDNVQKGNNDSIAIAQVAPDNKATYHSYFNYSADEDDDADAVDKITVTASAEPPKRTFFQKVTNAARKVNAFGLKNVGGEENNGKSSFNIGGLVVSETVSN